MKRILLLLVAFGLFAKLFAQIPPSYYNNATGLQGSQLKTALYNIIKGHTDKGYDGLYACYVTTDALPNGKVWDMYSANATGTANYYYTNSSDNNDQCGNYNSEGDCYNREHTFCDSWLGASSPQRSDLFHVVPTDGWVNNKRGSYPHGKVGTVSYTSSNGSKLGASDASTGYSGTVFEPIDEFKGDFARMYFYVATRYENLIAGWVNNGSANLILNGTSYPAYKPWFLNLMYQWHLADTVSLKEIDRNNAIYGYQHNRNPYIDHPEYVGLVWGFTGIGFAETNSVNTSIKVFPNPASHSINLLTDEIDPSCPVTIVLHDISGHKVYEKTALWMDLSTLDIITFQAGVYFLDIHNQDFTINSKLKFIKTNE